MSKLLTTLSTYIIIILAELGDKTQIATLAFASNNPTRRWQVYGASSLALVLCVAIEVTIGAALARHISPALINRIAGIVFLAVGVVSLVGALRRPASATGTESTSEESVFPEPPGRTSTPATPSKASSIYCGGGVEAPGSLNAANPEQPQ